MKRINRLIEQLKKDNIDSIFITSKENLFYYTGIYAEAHERLLALYVTVDEQILLICPALERNSVTQSGFSGAVVSYDDHEDPWKIFKEAVYSDVSVDVSVVAIEKDVLSVERYESLKRICPRGYFVDGQTLLNQMRLIKDADEYRFLKEAARFADFAVETAVDFIRPGVSELDVVAELEYRLKKEGIQEMSFATTVLTGVKSALPHGSPDTTVIQNGDFVLMDLGVIHEGYCSDITRTVVVGSASDKQKEIYETVLQAELKALQASQIGTPLGDIDRAARDHIDQAGYGEYFTHRIGHGLGIGVHEFPSLSQNNRDLLQAGMCYTIEPGIYVPDVGGVRIEDDVFITEDGPEALTRFTKELIEL